MKLYLVLFIPIFMALIPLAREAADETLTDPYLILGKYYEARGGLEKLKAIKTVYMVADIKSGRQQGTKKVWRSYPYKRRSETVLGEIKYLSVSDDKMSWFLDRNGKLVQRTGEDFLKKIEISNRMNRFEHLDHGSKVFSLTLKKSKKIGGVKHYAIELTNNVNSAKIFYYIDQNTFLLTKRIYMELDGQTEIWHRDYREVEGIMWSFHDEEITRPYDSKYILRWRKIETNVDIPESLFQLQVKSRRLFTFPENKDRVTVPVHVSKNAIYLWADFGKVKGYWVVDSGAASSVVSHSFARKLKLEKKGSTNAIGVGGKSTVYHITLPPFNVGGIRIDKLQAVSKQLFDHKPADGKYLNKRYIGLLGYDFLSQFVTKIDLKNKQFTFILPEKFNYKGRGRVVKAEVVNGHIRIPGTPENRSTGKWIIDTGAQMSHMNYFGVKKCKLMGRARRGNKIRVIGTGGETIMGLVKLKKFDIEGISIANAVFIAALKKGAGFSASKVYMGIIGMNILRHFKFYLDYDRQQVIFER